MNEAMVVQRLADMVGEMSTLPSQVGDDPDRIDVIGALDSHHGQRRCDKRRKC
jgi:hypothetical protein